MSTLRLLVLSALALAATAPAQVPSFINYQGRLLNGTGLVNGTVSLVLRLCDSPVGGAILCEDSNNVIVADGLYSTLLGDDAAPGSLVAALQGGPIYVETVVNGVTLAPRERMAAVGFAVTATGVRSPANVYGGDTASGPGGYSNNISAQAVVGGGYFNRAAGNASVVAGGYSNHAGGFNATVGGGIQNYANRQSTVAGGERNDASGLGAAIAGGFDNHATQDRATVAGGENNNAAGAYSAIGGGQTNSVSSSAGAIAGGRLNRIGALSPYSAIGGGATNRIGDNSAGAMVGGGAVNAIGDFSPNSVIAGGASNRILGYAGNSAIGGGFMNAIGIQATNATIAGGRDNAVRGDTDCATIAGGLDNQIGSNSLRAVVGGGEFNFCGVMTHWATIAGGYGNSVGSNAEGCVVGGGYHNVIGARAFESLIAGGADNEIAHNTRYAAIGGGWNNAVGSNAPCSFIAGGEENTVGDGAAYSFVAGLAANAGHRGCFVWADGSGPTFGTSSSNQFLVRATGGLGIGVTNPAFTADFGGRVRLRGPASGDTAGFWLYDTVRADDRAFVGMGGDAWVGLWGDAGAGWGLVMNITNGFVGIGTAGNPTSLLQVAFAHCDGYQWINASDRNLKVDFAPVDGRQVLEKVAALPVTEWSYRDDRAQARHLGPVAQDFHAAFGLNGSNDKGISSADASGVALAAIQGLYAEIKELRAENERLAARLQEIESGRSQGAVLR